LPAAAGEPYVFEIESGSKQTERVLSDASSGRVLGTLQPGWVDWMIDLHRNLLSGKPGRAAVGAFGILLMALSVSGILMWLTGVRNWKVWIAPPKNSTLVRFSYELHRLSGLWACAFLAVISFTGIGLAYPDAFKQFVQLWDGPSKAAKPPKHMKAGSLASLDQYLQAGRKAMPDGVITEMRLPQPKGGPVELRLYRAGDLSRSGNRVYLDPSTASLISVDRVSDRPLGARFLAALAPIHYGEFGGISIKAIWSLLALTPVFLFVTGAMVWWRRIKRKPNTPASRDVDRNSLALTGK